MDKLASRDFWVSPITWAVGVLFIIVGLLFCRLDNVDIAVKDALQYQSQKIIEMRLDQTELKAEIRADIKIIRAEVEQISKSLANPYPRPQS